MQAIHCQQKPSNRTTYIERISKAKDLFSDETKTVSHLKNCKVYKSCVVLDKIICNLYVPRLSVACYCRQLDC